MKASALSLLPFLFLAAAAPAGERAMPEIVGISAWINSPPLTRADLKGKVVLVDFWTHRCINCIRTLPHLVRWHDAYKGRGFLVLGVHTPEFEEEGKEANVRAAVAKFGIVHPVAMDNGFKTWNAFGNRYWPAYYLVDKKGRIRYTHIGEGAYAETEERIRQLLAEPA